MQGFIAVKKLLPFCSDLTAPFFPGVSEEQTFGCEGAEGLQDSGSERSGPHEQGCSAQLEAHDGEILVSMPPRPCLLKYIQGMSSFQV